MIQRIQTVWLLLIFLLNSGLSGSGVAQIHPYPLAVDLVFALTALLSVGIIFLYKRRPLQIKGGYVILALQILYALLLFLIPKEEWSTIVSSVRNYFIFFPLISFVLAVLAIRAVKKDEKRVRSLDRLR